MHSRLVIPLPKGLMCEQSGPRMVTTYTIADLSKDVVLLFGGDAFHIRHGIAAFVEDVVDDCISCRSILQFPSLGLAEANRASTLA
ncbi:unnamed protein product [Prunus armeniaca]